MNHNAEFYSQIRDIEAILIRHRRFMDIVERLQYVRDARKNGADPRHTLLVGESGTGKTWIARYLQSLSPALKANGVWSVPILYIETPATPTLKGLAETLLIALGDPISHRGSAADKRTRALQLMKKCGVELVVFDEFQHFFDHGRHHSLQSVADWLKLFIEDSHLPTLLMGLPRCEQILQVNEQLRRRFSARLDLPGFSIDSEDGEIEFRALLKTIDSQLPTEQTSGLADVEMARRLYFASNGLIGYLRKLITGAFEIMVLDNRKILDQKIFERAFIQEIWGEGIGSLNPFHKKFEYRRLDRQGEPFSLPDSFVKRVRKKSAL